MPHGVVAQERQFSTALRDKLATKGKAMPDGSFPIENAADLRNAISLVGRAKNPAAAKRHIIERAKALGLTKLLPAGWTAKESAADRAKEGSKEPTKEGSKEAVAEGLPAVTRANEVTALASEAVFTTSDDGTKPRAEVVIIRPGQNRSAGSKAKLYTRESIADAVRKGFWAGSPMFVDHGPNEKMPKQRSARDLVSAISNKPGEVWIGQEGEARGMVDFFDPAWAAKVEQAKEHIGLSNNADVRGRRYRDSQTKELNFQVDEFTNRHSVDWVAFPSAGGGVAQFITATESEEDMGLDWDALTPEMLAEHRPDLVTEIRAAAESDDGDSGDAGEGEETPPAGTLTLTQEAVEELIDKRVKLAQEAFVEQTSKQADVRAKIGAKLATSGLKSPKTIARLAAAFDGQTEYVEETVQEAIDEAKAELKENGAHVAGPQPTEFGNGAGGEKPVVKLGAEAIEGAPSLTMMAKTFGIKPQAASTGKEN